MQKRNKKHHDELLIGTYLTMIRYEHPTKGWVEEEFEVKRYKTVLPLDVKGRQVKSKGQESGAEPVDLIPQDL